MIALIEPLSEGAEHSPVNGALLEIVGLAYPDEALAFFGTEAHIAEVKAVLDPALVARTAWRAGPVPSRLSKTSERFIGDARLLRRAASEVARAPGSGLLFVLQGIPPVLLAAAFGRRLGLIRARVQVVMHGYLNEIVGWRSRNPLSRFADMRSALAATAGSVTLVALETGIREAMLAEMPRVGACMETLRHPLPVLNAAYPPVGAVPGEPVRFGFLGLATPAKGFDVFVAAAERLKPKYGDAIEFHAIGRLGAFAPAEAPSAWRALSTLPSRGPVPRADYDAGVAALHYVCVPFDAHHYTLSPSGSLLDALAHGKPILASSTPATREIFEEGQPGVLVERREDLSDVIEKTFLAMTPERYARQVEAMQRARAWRDPHRLAEDYARFTGPIVR